LPDSGAGVVRPGQDSEGPPGLRPNEPTEFPTAEDLTQQAIHSKQSRELPYVRSNEAVRVVKVGRPAVELMSQRIIPWPGRNRIGANVGHSSTVGQVIDTLGPRVVPEDSQPMRHALFG
jgi:hypothetical protein